MRVYEWRLGLWRMIDSAKPLGQARRYVAEATDHARVMTTDKGIIRMTTPKESYMIGTSVHDWNKGA